MSMSRPGQRHRGIDPDHSVTKAFEVPSHTALSTADVDRQPPCGWNQGKEGVTVETPVAVVVGGASPRDPLICVDLPRIPQHRLMMAERRIILSPVATGR